MTARFGIIGQPVAHSSSPQIHQQFAAQFDLDISYERIDCSPQSFAATTQRFFDSGGEGLNVTLPHKQSAFLLADRVAMRARLAGAVNTLSVSGEGLTGDNTDGTGLLRDLLVNLDVRVRDSRILVIGAGGAARGIAGPLLGQSPARFVVANRSFNRAVELVEQLSALGNIHARQLEQLQAEHFDLVINATAAGLDGEFPDLEINARDAVCYDLVYGAEPTSFMQWAVQRGARAAHDGWGMLVEQAAEAFYIWHRQWPDTVQALATRPTGSL